MIRNTKRRNLLLQCNMLKKYVQVVILCFVNRRTVMADVYFFRQLLVMTTLFLHSMCDGISYSFPGIVNMVILSPNTTDIRATTTEASNIAAIPGLGAFIGIFFTSILLRKVGRRLTYRYILIVDLVSWLILPFAKTVTAILVSRLLRGLGDGLLFNSFIVSEYADPKRRGYYCTSRKLFVGVGALVSHTMALRYTYREISIFATVCLLIATILTFFWPESPTYNAFRGRFDECRRDFVWLHGDGKEKNDELNNLMGAQLFRLEKEKNNKEPKFKTAMKTIVKKDFLKASFISVVLLLLLDLSGRHYYLAFINQVFYMIVDDVSVAGYCSIMSDALTILTLVASSFVIYNFKRRTLLFTFGFSTAILMFIISISEVTKSKISIGSWFEPIVVLILTVIVNMGVVPVNIILAVEIYPIEYRGYDNCVMGVGLIISTYLFGLKLTPIMVNRLGLDGTFCIFGFSIIFFLIILYFMIPETKDRTIQDIEDEFKNIDKSIIELRPMLLKGTIDSV